MQRRVAKIEKRIDKYAMKKKKEKKEDKDEGDRERIYIDGVGSGRRYRGFT